MEDKKKLIIVGLVVALVLGVVVAVVLSSCCGEKGGSSDDDSFPIVIWIPIWFGAMVPLLSARKRGGQTPEQKKRVKIAVAVGVVALLAGVVVFALML